MLSGTATVKMIDSMLACAYEGLQLQCLLVLLSVFAVQYSGIDWTSSVTLQLQLGSTCFR